MASFFYSNDESSHIDTQGRKRPMLSAVSGAEDPSMAMDTLPEGAPRRAEVRPPSQFAVAHPTWRTWLVRAWQWLWALDEAPRVLAPSAGIRPIQSEFVAALWDLQSLRANQVRDQIEAARSLRELWHLRADVFKVISTHRGQIEAQLRLDALDGHFPVRASRRSDEPRGHVTTW